MSEVIVRGIPGSPYVRTALLGLIESGAPHRLAPLAPGGHRSPDYLTKHPFGRVPVIEHDDFVLYESQAILRYADQVFAMGRLTPTRGQWHRCSRSQRRLRREPTSSGAIGLGWHSGA